MYFCFYTYGSLDVIISLWHTPAVPAVEDNGPMGKGLLRFTRMVRSGASMRGETQAPLNARRYINKHLSELQISATARRAAAIVIFRQARRLMCDRVSLLHACHLVLASYRKWSREADSTFTIVASMERRGLCYEHVDQQLAVLDVLRREAGYQPSIRTTTIDAACYERMNELIEQLSEAYAHAAIFAASQEGLCSATTLATTFLLRRGTDPPVSLVEAWQIVALSEQIGIVAHLPAFLEKFGTSYLDLLFRLMEERRVATKDDLGHLTGAHGALTEHSPEERLPLIRHWDDSGRPAPLSEFARAARKHRAAL